MADDSPYPNAPFLVPPLPEKVTTTTTHGTDVETKQLDPRQQQYFGDLAGLREQESQNEEKKAEQAKAAALLNVEIEKQKTAELDKQVAAQQEARDKTQNDITAWSSRLKDARDKFDGAKTQSFFRDGDTHIDVLKGIAFALGGISDAMKARVAVMTGHDQGPSTVDQIVDNDMARQKEDIKLLSDKVAMSKAGLDDANQARALLLAEVDTKSAMVYKRIQQIAAANLASQGVAQADIAKNDNIAKWREKELEGQASAVNGMTKQITKQGTDVAVTLNENKPDKSKATTPGGYTDTYSGQVLPVDPTLTETRAYGTAVKQLPQVNAALQTADKLITGGEKGGQGLPEWLSIMGADTTKQAEYKADVIKFRNAYGIAKGGESQAIPSKEELLDAIPNPPSSFASKETWANYMAKIRSAKDDVMNVRKGFLANLGVHLGNIDAASDPSQRNQLPASQGAPHLLERPGEAPAAAPGMKDSPEDVNSSAPLPEDPSAEELPDAVKTPRRLPGVAKLKSIPAPAPAPALVPGAPATEMVSDPRARAIAKLKANPNLPGARAVMQAFGITPEDLR